MRTKEYQTILADPPWQINQTGNRGAVRHYPLMSVKAICGLPVARLAAPDAHLWLWVTNSTLTAGQAVMAAWASRTGAA
jgi:N6-adenosine-specific RNA methylase IME4